MFKTLHFFAAGVLGALAYNQLIANPLWKRWSGTILTVSLVAFALSFPNIAAAWGAAFAGFWSPWLLALTFTIIVASSTADGKVVQWLGSRTGRLLGDLSFGIYLLHSPVIFFVAASLGDRPMIVRLLLASLVTFALAWLSLRCLERPARMSINRAFSERKLDGEAPMRQPYLNT